MMDFKKLSPEQMKIAEMVIEAAEANKIDPNLLLAQAFRESAFKHIPNKETDAFGVMQIRPGTAEQNQLGDITDLRTNIFGGAKLMRQYLDKYKSPEAALLAYHQGPGVAETYIKSGGDLKSVGPKGLDYVINIGENGGFGQPAKSEDATKQDNANNPFASGVPLADKAREGSDTEEVKKEPVTLLEKASALANEIDPALAGAVGAVVNMAGSRFIKPPLTPAEIASLSAEKKLELNREELQKAAPSGTTDLEDAYKQNQGEFERLKNEQKLAEARLKGLPKTSPTVEPPAPSSLISQIDLTRTGPASGPKIEGDSGARNWTIRTAGQKHQMPEAVLDMVTDQTGTTKTGGMTLIRKDLENLQKIKDLGMGDSKLVTTAGGLQIQLPATSVAERQAEIDQQTQANQAELERRTEETRVQQEAQARALEQQRLAHEAEVARIQQERAQLGQQQNAIAGELKDVKPLKKAVTQAEQAAKLAKYNASLKAQNQPMTAQDLLNKGKAVGRPVVGGLAGAAGVMSLQEALERFKAGDTSEGVLKTIQASSAAAMLTPPMGKNTSRLRKAGALGAIGSYGYDFGRELFRKNPQEGQ
jgi:hypothetical protein